MEHGEDVHTAAIREVFEETGITDLKDFRFLGFEFNRDVSKKDHIVFLAAKTLEDIRPRRAWKYLELNFRV